MEQLLKATIEMAVHIEAVQPKDLERVIVDATVQGKAIAHHVDNRFFPRILHPPIRRGVSPVTGFHPHWAIAQKVHTNRAPLVNTSF